MNNLKVELPLDPKTKDFVFPMYMVEGKHVRKNAKGIYWIPKPNKRVKDYMDSRFVALDDRHWKEKE